MGYNELFLFAKETKLLAEQQSKQLVGLGEFRPERVSPTSFRPEREWFRPEREWFRPEEKRLQSNSKNVNLNVRMHRPETMEC